jgi:hypothetical protein
LIDAWEGVGISDCAIVQSVVVNDWSFGTILLWDEEYWGSSGTMHGTGFDHASCKHFIKPLVHCDQFFLTEVVWLHRLWQGGIGFQVNSKIIFGA